MSFNQVTPIRVVSLKSDVLKRDNIEIALKKLKVDFKYQDAIRGRDVIDKESLKAKFIDYGRLVGDGELGCTLSHLSIYKEMIDKDIAWMIILEDDVIPGESLYDLSINDFSVFDDRYLYILGGQNGLESEMMQKTSLFNKIKLGNVTFRKQVNSERYIYRTCCYLVSLSVAKSIYEQSKYNLFLADDWQYLMSNGCFSDIYITDIVKHPIELTDSSIEVERKSHSESLNRWSLLVGLARRFKGLLREVYRLKK